MSFLNELFQFPDSWNDRWQSQDGVIVYNPSTQERIALGENVDEAEEELPFSLSYAKNMLDDDQMSLIMRLASGQQPLDLSSDFGSGQASVVLDNEPKNIWADPNAKHAGTATDVESEEPEVAVPVAEPSETESETESDHSKDKAEHDASSEPEKDAHEDDHGHGGGHGHKKDPKEMSGVELASIAGTCNAKVLKLVLKKGADAALINVLGNPAMDAEKVAWIVTHRAPTGTVLGAVGRCRFAKDPRVAAAICKNPKSPLHLARGLLGRLSTHDLKDVLKAPGLPNALKSQARSKLERKKK